MWNSGLGGSLCSYEPDWSKGFQNDFWPTSPKPHPSKPHPCNMPQAKTEVALQFSECCAAETALQHRLFCNAEVIWTKSCAAANEKLHCSVGKAVLQESGAFLPLSCGFQVPTFRHPRFWPADPRRLAWSCLQILVVKKYLILRGNSRWNILE